MSLIHEEIKRLRAEVNIDGEIRNADREFKSLLHHNGNDQGREEPFRDSTYLYIKSFAGDAGGRPISPGMVFWNSPDVELFDGSTLIATNELKAGHPYQVRVLVTNDGDYAATACTVDLFICHPSLALNLSNAKLIGAESTYINGHDSAFVTFSFTATTSDIGHRCLFARAYNIVSKDMPIDADWFNTPIDRHTAQQNLSVVKQGDAFMMQISPVEAGLVNIRISRHVGETRLLQAYNFARDLTFTTARVEDRFDLLQSTQFTLSNISIRRFISLKRHAIKEVVGRTRSPRFRRGISRTNELNEIRLASLTNVLQPYISPTANNWQLERGDEPGTLPITAILDIPHLELKTFEAAVYQVEMVDAQGQVKGGITLVVTG